MPADPKKIRLRYAGQCTLCAAALAAGVQAWWNSAAKTVTCEGCHPPAVHPDPPDAGIPEPPPLDRGVSGASAQREYERRHDKREQRIRERFPRVGGLWLALVADPQSTTAWARGAEGERQLAARLEELAGRTGMVLLHDRRIPASRANIDHVIVAPAGVFVIDAKRYEGQVQKRDVGGFFRRDERLFVDGRDKSKLVAGLHKQVEAIRRAGGEVVEGMAVVPVICFVGAEWSFFARPFRIDGVWVGWPKALCDLLGEPGPLTPEGIDFVARRLAAHLPPA